MAKQKQSFKVEGRTPSNAFIPISRSLVKTAAKAGGLSTKRWDELIDKMEQLNRWNQAERDDPPASDLRLAMAAFADALFHADNRKNLMGSHARRLLSDTYVDYCPKVPHERPNTSMAKPEYFGGPAEKEDPSISLRRRAMDADLAALERLARMAVLAAGPSKGGRERLFDGVADAVLAIWQGMVSKPIKFGRRDNPFPDFHVCQMLLHAMFPRAPLDKVAAATWEAFSRRPKAKKSGQETPGR
jgi:hypothetical protein